MEALKYDFEKHYTYSDYLKWEGDERFELIDGKPYLMSPAPSRAHQKIAMSVLGQLYVFLKDKPCELYPAPFDVRLNSDEKDDTVVQPDITIVCDKTKLDKNGCKGAPDMVVEIISPQSSKRDEFIKFNKYLKAGVREYWIINPDIKTAAVHLLKDGAYVKSVYSDEDEVRVNILDGCIINLGEVFSEDDITA